MQRRALVHALAACAISPTLGIGAASAADYPTRPIRILVPFAAGGGVDVISRLVGQKLAAQLGQPVVIENRPGASEQLAIAGLTSAPADGYTLVMTSMLGLSINPSLYGKALRYDPAKDLAPIVHVTAMPSVVVVHPKVPANTMAELKAYLLAHPGKISYGSASVGTPSHLGMERYKRMTGVDAAHVPYKGGAPALLALTAGDVQVMLALAPEAMPLVQAGKLKAIALVAPTRSAMYPQLPTTVEQGLSSEFMLDWWNTLAAKAGTPAAVIERLNTEVNIALKDKALAAQLAERGIQVAGGTVHEATALARRDAAVFKEVIENAGIKAE
ncbi:tripartite-type tricarboxylate transporter receptor subunit TctC [Comamonas sp. BIGb0152]|uniref:Bug family tripartite tricarboxylate transporter substrate binding protein n=1 Tax=Comamonas sp. BIGb0152 TaxID=2940601 RepID=UPI0021685E3E|nr:tripartite tricarboxylate transporter substrate-binding protein [Comamonas sp. BIGb0152]MCS4296269.1 tripartite-type tricarboxylate transporter receptor subunit TctC [Comamonas sp. BIGb0152]